MDELDLSWFRLCAEEARRAHEEAAQAHARVVARLRKVRRG